MRKKQKKQKVLNYKKAYRHAKAVIKASEQGKLARSESAEKFVEELEKHITKKGTLKKRDIRSNIQIANINKIIYSYTSKNDINKSVKKLKEEFIYRAENLTKKRVSENVERGKDMIKNFVNFSNYNLQNIFFLSSDQIVDLSNEYGEITVEDIDFITKELLQNKINNTPNELIQYIQDDDFYKLTDKILNLIRNGGFSKEDISFVFSNSENDVIYSEEQENIFEYLSDNNIFNIGR